MTEYNYTPEAKRQHEQTRRRTTEWISRVQDQSSQFRNPFVASPAVNSQPLPSASKPDRHHSTHRRSSPERKASTKSQPSKHRRTESTPTRDRPPPTRSNTLPTQKALSPLKQDTTKQTTAPKHDNDNPTTDLVRHRSHRSHHHSPPPRIPDYERGELGPYIPHPDIPRRSHTTRDRSKSAPSSSKPSHVRSNSVPLHRTRPPPEPEPEPAPEPERRPAGSEVGFVLLPTRGIKSASMVPRRKPSNKEPLLKRIFGSLRGNKAQPQGGGVDRKRSRRKSY